MSRAQQLATSRAELVVLSALLSSELSRGLDDGEHSSHVLSIKAKVDLALAQCVNSPKSYASADRGSGGVI